MRYHIVLNAQITIPALNVVIIIDSTHIKVKVESSARSAQFLIAKNVGLQKINVSNVRTIM